MVDFHSAGHMIFTKDVLLTYSGIITGYLATVVIINKTCQLIIVRIVIVINPQPSPW